MIRLTLPCLLVVLLASCGEEQYVPRRTTQQQKPTEVTGFLVNAQQIEKNVDAAQRKVQHWEVIDDSGTALLSSEMVDPQFQRLKGVMFQWKKALALEEGKALHLGRNHVEIRVRETKISGEGTEQKATMLVSSADASTLRSIPNRIDLNKRANIVILVGKIGD